MSNDAGSGGEEFVTILAAGSDHPQAKRWTRKGGKWGTRTTASIAEWRMYREPFATIDNLAAIGEKIHNERPDCALIQGGPSIWNPCDGTVDLLRLKDPQLGAVYNATCGRVASQVFAKLRKEGRLEAEIEADRVRLVTWLPMFQDAPTRVLLLDFDKLDVPGWWDWQAPPEEWPDQIALLGEEMRARLGPEFDDVKAWCCLSSSAGHPARLDKLGLRMIVVTDRPICRAQRKYWLKGRVDTATLEVHQLSFIAAPVLPSGVADPIPCRYAMLDGLHEAVTVPKYVLDFKETSNRRRRAVDPTRVTLGTAEGLKPSKALADALEGVFEMVCAEQEAGTAHVNVREKLWGPISAYIAEVGAEAVDPDALADHLGRFVVEAGLRSEGEVAGYSIDRMVMFALANAHADDGFLDHLDVETAAPVAYPEHGGTIDEATATITAALDELVADALAWPEKLTTAKAQHKAWQERQAERGEFDFSFTDPEPKIPQTPGLGIDATPGAGKTELAIDRAVRPMLAQGPVIMAAPDHDLASAMVRRIEKAGLQATQIYGRDQQLPDGTPVCHYADVAKLLGIEGFSIKKSLCERKPADDALPTIYCPHHPNNQDRVGPPCRYLLQFKQRNAQRVHVCTHAHLTESRNRVPLPTSPSLVVVDENPTGSLLVSANATTDRTDFPADALARPYTLTRPTKSGRETLVDESAELSDLLGRIRRALEVPDASPRTLRDAGINHAWLAQSAGHIWTHTRAQDIAEIIPGMPKDGMLSLIEQHASGKRKTERTLLRLIARMLDALAEVIDLDVDEIRPIEQFEREGSRWLRLVHSQPIRTDEEPLLLLDGSADREVMAALVPQVQCWIDAKIDTSKATIRQIVDRRVSMTALCPDVEFARPKDLTTARNNRIKIARMLEVEALKGKRVACISYKAVCDPKSEIALQNEHPKLVELGMSFGWFGKMRGQNAWSDCDVLFVIGRICPKVRDLERQARAIFWKDERSLERLSDTTELPKRRVGLRMRDDRSKAVQDEYHPCLLTDRVLRQVCAAELAQAVHRARGVRRTCEVALVTSAPCDVTVTNVTTWLALLPSRLDVAAAQSLDSGFLPLSPTELAARYPDLWRNSDAAKKDAQRAKGQWGQTPIVYPYGVCPRWIQLRYWTSNGSPRGYEALVRWGIEVKDVIAVATHLQIPGGARTPLHKFEWPTDQYLQQAAE